MCESIKSNLLDVFLSGKFVDVVDGGVYTYYIELCDNARDFNNKCLREIDVSSIIAEVVFVFYLLVRIFLRLMVKLFNK